MLLYIKQPNTQIKKLFDNLTLNNNCKYLSILCQKNYTSLDWKGQTPTQYIKVYQIPSPWEQLDQLRLAKQSIRLCNQLACAMCTCFENLDRRSLPGGEAWHTLAKGAKHIFVKCNFPAVGECKIPGEWPFPTGDIVNAGFLKNFIENAGDSCKIQEGWHVWVW